MSAPGAIDIGWRRRYSILMAGARSLYGVLRTQGKMISLRKKSTALVPFLLMTALWAQALFPVPAVSSQDGQPTVGELVPPFHVSDQPGRSYTLSELTAENKQVIVFFWVYRCAICISEMAFLEGLYNEFKGRGLSILAVEATGRTRDQVEEILAQYREMNLIPSYSVVADPEAKLRRIFGVVQTPESFIIDRERRVSLHLSDFNEKNKEILRGAVEEALLPGEAAVAAGPPSGEDAVGAPGAPGEVGAAADPEEAYEKNRYFADFYAHREEYDRAISHYRLCIEAAPEKVYPRMKLGEIHALKEEYGMAREAWEEVLRIDPGNEAAADSIRRLAGVGGTP